ncbi:MAG: class I SAM-dependent methyltransferase [Acidobacteria bacterium]|nr:class I SAM-dependent methyltransferase [Acidobacteriota bacterium]
MKEAWLKTVGLVRGKWAHAQAKQDFFYLGCHWVIEANVVNPSLISASRVFAKQAIQVIPDQAKTALDLGTGSGLAAILLAQKGLKVTAVDVSTAALENARANATRNGVELTLFLSDWDASIPPGQKFDYVVSNPPYLVDAQDPAFSAGEQLKQLLRCYHAVRRRLAPGGQALLVSSSWSGRSLVLEHLAAADLRILQSEKKFCGNEWLFLDQCEGVPCS